jgi:hypothetical protein
VSFYSHECLYIDENGMAGSGNWIATASFRMQAKKLQKVERQLGSGRQRTNREEWRQDGEFRDISDATLRILCGLQAIRTRRCISSG